MLLLCFHFLISVSSIFQFNTKQFTNGKFNPISVHYTKHVLIVLLRTCFHLLHFFAFSLNNWNGILLLISDKKLIERTYVGGYYRGKKNKKKCRPNIKSGLSLDDKNLQHQLTFSKLNVLIGFHMLANSPSHLNLTCLS